MSVLEATNVLRPGPKGVEGLLMGLIQMPAPFAFLRRVWPIPHFKTTWAVTRYDDVREAFANDAAFGVPYKAKLDGIMEGSPFVLGMEDGPDYHADIAALGQVFEAADLPVLAERIETAAEAIVAGANGRLEVVDGLVRRVAFDVLCGYMGIGAPQGGDLRVWSTRLFEYQFFADDAELKAEVAEIAPAMRAHIDGEIARTKAEATLPDTVLGRCIARQRAGDARFTDRWIRTELLGMVIGGPPQPPMVVPQGLEQLLQRPKALAAAQAAARADDDAALFGQIYEAMRFDPIAPFVPRVTVAPATIAAGTPRAVTIPAGCKVLVGIASAMRDPRRLNDPQGFDPLRPRCDYFQMGHGVHVCFGRHINRATLHLMLKPLLKRANLRRAAGKPGRLTKAGLFADALTVEFD